MFLVPSQSSECPPRSWFLLHPVQVCFLDKVKLSSGALIPRTVSYPEGDDSLFRSWFSICHLVGMLSALSNPVLYGYYNKVQSSNNSMNEYWILEWIKRSLISNKGVWDGDGQFANLI